MQKFPYKQILRLRDESGRKREQGKKQFKKYFPFLVPPTTQQTGDRYACRTNNVKCSICLKLCLLFPYVPVNS